MAHGRLGPDRSNNAGQRLRVQCDAISFVDAESFSATFHADAVLVTFSVRSGEAMNELLGPICRTVEDLRNSGVPVAVVHCENDPEPMWSALKARVGHGIVECLDSMVDRICPPLVIEGDDVVVFHESFSQWVVGLPQHAALTAMFSALADTAVVSIEMSDEIEHRRALKRLLVNGSDIILGLHGFVDGVKLVGDVGHAAEGVVRGLAAVGQLTGTIGAHITIDPYVEATHQRLASSRNPVSKAIPRFNWKQLDDFFANADLKLGEELRFILDNDQTSPALDLFGNLTEIFGSGRRLLGEPGHLHATPYPSRASVLDAFDRLVGPSKLDQVTAARGALTQALRYLD